MSVQRHEGAPDVLLSRTALATALGEAFSRTGYPANALTQTAIATLDLLRDWGWDVVPVRDDAAFVGWACTARWHAHAAEGEEA